MTKSNSNWYVYVVRCSDNTLYTGITTDVTRRLEEHNNDNSLGARYTRHRRPVSLIYSETYETRSAASIRECEIKKMPRTKKELLINNTEEL